MALDLHALQLSLRTRLRTISDYPGDSKVAWQGRAFQPPDPTSGSSLWLRETMLPGSERRSSTGHLEAIGMYQLDVVTPWGHGFKEAAALQKSIVEAFEPGNDLAGVHVYRTERVTPRADPSPRDPVWLVLPILVYWRAFSPVVQQGA